MISFHGGSPLFYAFDSLHNHSSGCTTTVADGCHTILTRLQLMEECGQDARTGTSQGVTKRNGTAQEIDLGILETEDLKKIVRQLKAPRKEQTQPLAYLFIRFDDSGECLVELPNGDIILGDSCTLQGNWHSFGWRNGEINRIDGGIGRADNAS